MTSSAVLSIFRRRGRGASKAEDGRTREGDESERTARVRGA